MVKVTLAAMLMAVSAFGQESGRRLLGVIGIGEYTNASNFTPVKPAANSARRAQVLLTENFGYTVHGTALLDASASVDSMRGYLKGLAETAGPGDDVLVYFAGHGAQGSLAAYDGKLLPIKEVLDLFRESRARNVLAVVDACGSGIALPPLGSVQQANTTTGAGRIVITSAGPNQPAVAAGGSGGTTRFSGDLLDILQSTACDISAEGYCTAMELALMVRRRVMQKAPGQTPMFGSFGGDESADLRLYRRDRDTDEWKALRCKEEEQACIETAGLEQFINSHPDSPYTAAAKEERRRRMERALRKGLAVRTNDIASLAGVEPRASVTRVSSGSEYMWVPARPDARPVMVGQLRTQPGGGFWMGKYEVSVKEYEEYSRALPRAPSFNKGWRDPHQPMVNVSWAEAQAYCSSHGGRLPTPGEWEYAARAGGTEDLPWPKDRLEKLANVAGQADGHLYPAPVDSFKDGENEWHLRNMIGNVEEWTAEVRDKATTPRAKVAGSGFATRKAFVSLGRFGDAELSGSNTVGFRCMVIPQTTGAAMP